MTKNIRSFEDFKTELRSNQQLQDQFRKDPIQAIEPYEQRAIDRDVWIYRIIVLTLGLTVLVIVIGILMLIWEAKLTDDKSIPTIFTAMGSAAIGALAGLLAPSPRQANNN